MNVGLERILNPWNSAIYRDGRLIAGNNPNITMLGERWQRFKQDVDRTIGDYVVDYLIEQGYERRPEAPAQLEVLTADGIPQQVGGVSVDLYRDLGSRVNQMYQNAKTRFHKGVAGFKGKAKERFANILAMPAMAYLVRGNSPDQAYNILHEKVHNELKERKGPDVALSEKHTYRSLYNTFQAFEEGRLSIPAGFNKAYVHDMYVVAKRALELYEQHPYEGTPSQVREKIMKQIYHEIDTGKLEVSYRSHQSKPQYKPRQAANPA